MSLTAFALGVLVGIFVALVWVMAMLDAHPRDLRAAERRRQ